MNITADTTTGTSTHTDAVAGTAPAEQPRTGARDADGMAVASFVLGLLGLLVLNLFLGPIAIVLAGLALMRGTARRGRALLGLGLGIADLAVLAAFVATDHTLSWSLAG
ncbi:DUF4190 domain-containing protein [Streptomyces sp. NPDC055400]